MKKNIEAVAGAHDSQALEKDFEIIRNSLLLQKSEIMNRDSEFKKSQESISRFSDEADQTAQELQNNVSIHLHERERKSLLLIEKTLSKFSEGTYGLCEGCGDNIGLQRLQARPLAALCIACMEEIENGAQHMRPKDKGSPVVFQ